MSQINERNPWMWDTWVQKTSGRVTTFCKSINNLIYLPIPVPARSADPRTPSKHSSKFRHFATNTNAYKFPFFPRTIPLWNSPPTKAVTATSPEAFPEIYALPISLEPFATRNQQERTPYIALYFKAFYRYVSWIIFEKCVVTPNFLFGFQ